MDTRRWLMKTYGWRKATQQFGLQQCSQLTLSSHYLLDNNVGTTLEDDGTTPQNNRTGLEEDGTLPNSSYHIPIISLRFFCWKSVHNRSRHMKTMINFFLPFLPGCKENRGNDWAKDLCIWTWLKFDWRIDAMGNSNWFGTCWIVIDWVEFNVPWAH